MRTPFWATGSGLRVPVIDRFAVGGVLVTAGENSEVLFAASVTVATTAATLVFWTVLVSGVSVTMVTVAGITVLGTAIPSAPGYVGTFELAAAGMAGALVVAPSPALAMAVVAHVMTLMPMALGGAVALTVAGTSLGDAAREASTARAT